MNAAADASTDDIAYVRKLAESAARAPLIGGRFMAWWGLLVTIAYSAHHHALNGGFGDSGSKFAFIWIAFSLAGGIGQTVLGRSMPAKAGAGSAGNRAARAAWVAAVGAIASIVVAAVVAATQGRGYGTFDWIAPVAFAVYGCAQIVSGSLAGNRIVTAAGVIALVMVGVAATLIAHPDRYLIAAGGAALSVLVPGLLLLRAEPKSEV